MKSQRIIAYKPAYFNITKSIEATLLLSQAEFHTKNLKDGKVFAKTSEVWEAETGLTYEKQKTARRILRQFPFWKEIKGGIPKRLYYEVDLNLLAQYVSQQEKQTIDTPVTIMDYGIKNVSDMTEVLTGNVNSFIDNNEEATHTSESESHEQVRGNPSYKYEEIPRSIYIDNKDIYKYNNNTITETESFGRTDGNSNKLTKGNNGMKKTSHEKSELINFYEAKLTSNRLMENFTGKAPWFSEVNRSQLRYLTKTLAVRLSQGKVLFEKLEPAVYTTHTISDLLLALGSEKYPVQDILKDLIFIYADGLVSAWSRETKAIGGLVNAINDGNTTVPEIEDCLIWIKNTMNYSLSLTSIIPSLQYFRKYRTLVPNYTNRHSCTYTFNTRNVKNTSQTVAVTTESVDDFFNTQKIRR